MALAPIGVLEAAAPRMIPVELRYPTFKTYVNGQLIEGFKSLTTSQIESDPRILKKVKYVSDDIVVLTLVERRCEKCSHKYSVVERDFSEGKQKFCVLCGMEECNKKVREEYKQN